MELQEEEQRKQEKMTKKRRGSSTGIALAAGVAQPNAVQADGPVGVGIKQVNVFILFDYHWILFNFQQRFQNRSFCVCLFLQHLRPSQAGKTFQGDKFDTAMYDFTTHLK